MGRNPYTALLALSTVVLQTATTYAMGRLGFGYWWLSLLIAYCIGAFANHANYVIPHDATHNLIFRNKSWNKMVAIMPISRTSRPARLCSTGDSFDFSTADHADDQISL